MDYSGYEQCPTCLHCGVSHWGSCYQASNPEPPYPLYAFLEARLPGNTPEAPPIVSNPFHCFWCGGDHLSSQCHVNFSSGPSYEPTYCTNSDVCRTNRYPQYQELANTYSADYHREYAPKWEYRGDEQEAGDHHIAYQGGYQPSFSWEEPYAESSSYSLLQPQGETSTTEEQLMLVLQHRMADDQRQFGETLEKAAEYEREMRESIQRMTNKLQEVQTALGLHDDIQQPEEPPTLEWSEEEKQDEVCLDERPQVPEAWLYAWYKSNLQATPTEEVQGEEEEEDPSQGPWEPKETCEEFKDPPREAILWFASQDPLVEDLIEKRELEAQLEAQVQNATLEPKELKGSFPCPSLTFAPLSPCMSFPLHDPLYILPITTCASTYWEMAVHGLPKLCSILQAPIFGAREDDVRILSKDVTFPFDRG